MTVRVPGYCENDVLCLRSKRFGRYGRSGEVRLLWSLEYPVVIINWVQYLGPPVPFSFPDSRGILEVLVDLLTVFGRRSTETSELAPISRESTFYLYSVKVESGFSRNDRFSVEVQLKRWAQSKTRK